MRKVNVSKREKSFFLKYIFTAATYLDRQPQTLLSIRPPHLTTTSCPYNIYKLSHLSLDRRKNTDSPIYFRWRLFEAKLPNAFIAEKFVLLVIHFILKNVSFVSAERLESVV